SLHDALPIYLQKRRTRVPVLQNEPGQTERLPQRMGRPESRCRHRPACRLRQPIWRQRDAAKERGEAGESGRVSGRNGVDQSEGRKGLRAVETTGKAARRQTAK